MKEFIQSLERTCKRMGNPDLLFVFSYAVKLLKLTGDFTYHQV